MSRFRHIAIGGEHHTHVIESNHPIVKVSKFSPGWVPTFANAHQKANFTTEIYRLARLEIGGCKSAVTVFVLDTLSPEEIETFYLDLCDKVRGLREDLLGDLAL